MKLIDTHYREDYGHEVYLSILATNRLNVLQCYGGFDDHAGKPYLCFTILGDSVLGFTAYLWRFTIDIDIFAYHPRNLNCYRKNWYES